MESTLPPRILGLGWIIRVSGIHFLEMRGGLLHAERETDDESHCRSMRSLDSIQYPEHGQICVTGSSSGPTTPHLVHG